MNLNQEIATQIKNVHFGGNWSASNLKEHLSGLTWKQATTKVYDFNTIAALTFHINYYIAGVAKFLQGEELTTRDKFSYDHPPINNQEDWQQLVDKTLAEATTFADLIEQLPEAKMGESFIDEKYGNYFKNFQGIIEHTHYHLGQIVLIKRIVLAEK